MVDEPALNTMNKLVFKVFLPLLLFHNVYTTDLSEAFNGRLILFAVGAVVLWFLFLMIVIPRIEKENSCRGVLVQAIFRSNFVLFGLPVAANLCGEENIGVTSFLVGIVVPVFNVLAVVSLEFFRGGKVNIKKVLKGIATNPLILASLLGVIFISCTSACRSSWKKQYRICQRSRHLCPWWSLARSLHLGRYAAMPDSCCWA